MGITGDNGGSAEIMRIRNNFIRSTLDFVKLHPLHDKEEIILGR